MSDVQIAPLPPEVETKVREAEKQCITYSYRKPEGVTSAKGMVRLGRGGAVRGVVQIVKKNGGENNLHYHTSADNMWMVLKGRVRFYGVGDKLLGEFGPGEGIFTPRYFRYWFENCGEDDLELLQVGAYDSPQAQSSGRTDCEPQRYELGTSNHFSVEKRD